MRIGEPTLKFWSYLFLVSLVLGMSCQPQQGARAQEVYCAATPQAVATALIDLGSDIYIRMDGQNTGFSGGLYPGGSNMRPLAHETAGIAIANQVTPLNSSGNPDAQGGKIVMVSIGMSNTNMEFETFMGLAGSDPALNPHLVLVNGATNGMTADIWANPTSYAWQVLDLRLSQAGITPQQVQVAWVKLTRTGSGDFPEYAQILQNDLLTILRHLKSIFPNLLLTYLSSRTNSYDYWSGLSPEPAAFETGFAVKWLIESQINGDPGLNYNPANGPVVAPYLSWSAYLWADGPNPRSDGLVWTQEDLLEDCTHPSINGREKVAHMLLDFFKTDVTTGWFLEGDAPPPPPPPSYQIFLPEVLG